ncbi:MAG: DUF1553 domain-containing protein, partial [Verrucomicrobiales bacterium]|nr:DUF1553 domain-containing protein [Verrucomicrobiales bacterium]
RDATNVPLQSLFFLNGPLINQQADVLAKRLTKDLEPEESRIRKAYLLLYGRPVTEEEIRLGRDFLAQASADSGGPPAWQQYAQALLSASEFYFMD